MSKDNWRMTAACSGMDTELFFSYSPDMRDIAMQICESCVVKQECLDDARKMHDKYGIRGGKLLSYER